MSKVKDKVLDLLVNFRSNERRIALLRYEIINPPHVTADEIIEALTFSHSAITGSSGTWASGSGPSDKVFHVALNYEDRMKRLNEGALNDIVFQLYALERQRERLLYYISLLDKTEEEIIRMTYIDGLVNEKIAQKLGISIRSVTKHRGQAINRLCAMFEFMSNLQNSKSGITE